MLILPSDHRVEGIKAFRRSVREGRRLARLGFLVTFGIPSAEPRSDFGYIVPGSRLRGGSRRVEEFVEKPTRALARRLMVRRGALWNSGIFAWRVDTFLREAARCEPSFARWLALCGNGRGIPAKATRAFRELPALPVDRAVLERSRRVAVVNARFGWSDLGTWSSVDGILPRGPGSNLRWGRLVAPDSRDNLVVHPAGLTVLSGIRGCLVVCSGGVVLVCRRSHAGRMREILRAVEKAGYGDYL
jgi:mannose-1-phosphate guanylyltransferase